MEKRDVPSFVEDCRSLVEVLRCAKETVTSGRGAQLLEDLVDQVEATRQMVMRMLGAVLVCACTEPSWAFWRVVIA